MQYYYENPELILHIFQIEIEINIPPECKKPKPIPNSSGENCNSSPGNSNLEELAESLGNDQTKACNNPNPKTVKENLIEANKAKLLQLIAETMLEEISLKKQGPGSYQALPNDIQKNNDTNTLKNVFLSINYAGDKFKNSSGNKIDATLVAKSIVSKSLHKLPECKYSYKNRDIYLFLDNSGSVSYLARLIGNVVTQASLAKNVQIWDGCESHPQREVRSGITYHSRHHKFIDSFTKFQKISKIPDNSLIIIWGDLEGTRLQREDYQQLKRYRTYFLYTNKKDSEEAKTNNDVKLANLLFNGFYYDIANVSKFTQSIKNIKKELTVNV